MEFIGLFLIYLIFRLSKKLKIKYGDLSYQKIIFVGFAGVTIILSLAIHNYVSIFVWNTSLWKASPFRVYVNPITMFLPQAQIQIIFRIIGFIISIFLYILGLIIVIRAIQIFGLDYLAVVYLYFPEESELQDHKIYSFIRHPTYAALIIISLGGVFLQLNLYSLLFFIIYYIGFYIHVHYVEEKELIKRFGELFLDYREKVPAFFVKPKKFPQLIKNIIGKNT
jgi:protein-S-isoprenylcysteine O-methyltransferase Ste14